MMSKTAAALIPAILAFSLTACSSQQQNETTAQTLQQTEASAAAGEESSSAGSELSDGNGASGANSSSGENGTSGESGTSGASDSPEGNPSSGSHILIAYFSVPETDGVDTVAGASRVATGEEVLGNNQYVAQLIQQETGGDLFRIETVQEYPGSHDPLLEFAYNERAEDARPELSTQIENLDSYDTIFLGYPNWNSDLPMPLYTFLEEYDFSGKTIIPFTVHGGSGFSRTIQTIQELQPGADVVEDGLSISRNRVTDAQSDVAEWTASLNLS